MPHVLVDGILILACLDHRSAANKEGPESDINTGILRCPVSGTQGRVQLVWR
jgi:hypothetical protein